MRSLFSKFRNAGELEDLPIVVINLDDRTDRWAAIQSELDRVGLRRPERFSAVQPTAMIETRPDYMPDNALPYRIGALGCLMSHYYVIKQARERGYEALLILEDDTAFKFGGLRAVRKALRQLRVDEHDAGFDILYLSGTHMKPCEPYKRNVVKVRRTFATNAYILRASLFDFLLENLLSVTIEIDVYYSQSIQQQFRSYCVKPHATYQSAGYSDIERKDVDYLQSKP